MLTPINHIYTPVNPNLTYPRNDNVFRIQTRECVVCVVYASVRSVCECASVCSVCECAVVIRRHISLLACTRYTQHACNMLVMFMMIEDIRYNAGNCAHIHMRTHSHSHTHTTIPCIP